MILTADYHTHTPYSHGKNTIAENACRAKELNLQQIAITDHGFSHVAYGLRRKDMPSYKAECAAAEKEYGIRVLVGIEANIHGISGNSDLTEKDYEDFDIYLCGNHVFIFYDHEKGKWAYGWGNLFARNLLPRVPRRLIRANTQAYINVIKKNPIDAITHVNFKCPCDPLEVAKVAADYGTYIELNSKKSHLSDEQLNDIVQKTQARFIVNSDAHSAGRVGDTKLVEEQLARLNFPMDRIDNIDGRLPNFRFAEFKKHL
ncbi:MAG: PHP domain-containing protein [Clostridia bacterium]|nr:PHP domain-containing protein [Clostridia bacterium]